MSRLTTSELLGRYRGGDTNAFAGLVHAHQAFLLRIARGLLGPRRPYEDVVQEAFLRLAERPPEVPRGDPAAEAAQLSSWLSRVTRNLCMDTLRADRRRQEREHEAATPEAAHDGQAELEAAETRAAVEAGLQALPLDQREVLVLRLLGDKSYREIAEITGKKIGTVGWLVSVGLRALSRELEPHFGYRRVAAAGRDLDVAGDRL